MRIKKLLIYLLIALLVMSLMVVAACDLILPEQPNGPSEPTEPNNPEDPVTPTDPEIVGISVFGPIEAYVDIFSYDDYTITVFYSDKTTDSVPLSASYLSSDDQAKLTTVGTHTVTVTYEGVSTKFSVKLSYRGYDMSGITFVSKSVKYDGKPHSLEIQGLLPNGVTVYYEGNGQTAVGTHKVTAKFIGAPNRQAIPDMTATLTITRETHTVTFKQDGQEDKVVRVLDLDALTDDQIPTPAQPDARYTYSWDLTGVDLTCITSDVTIQAVKTAKVYNITYHLYGGQNHPDNPTTYTCETDTITLKDPLERKNYTFAGWFDSENFTGEAITEIPQGSHGDVHLYAKWESMGGLIFKPVTGGYAVSGYDGSDTIVVIPSTFLDGAVVEISANAFKDSIVTKVAIPSSVTTISSTAFYACSDLQTIWVDSGNTVYKSVSNCVIEIATGKLVVGCNNSVIPNDGSVKSIGGSAFEYCTGLTSITIPSSVTSIDYLAFSVCSSLQTVTFEKNIKLHTIGNGAFNSCSSLTSIVIPAYVKLIDHNAFSRCSGLQTVTFEKDSELRTIGVSAFSNCTGLTSITIPSSVVGIDRAAFYKCTDLQSVYYTGTVEKWEKMVINENGNECLTNATRYYYSETPEVGKWHFDVDGTPALWKEEDLQ